MSNFRLIFYFIQNCIELFFFFHVTFNLIKEHCSMIILYSKANYYSVVPLLSFFIYFLLLFLLTQYLRLRILENYIIMCKPAKLRPHANVHSFCAVLENIETPPMEDLCFCFTSPVPPPPPKKFQFSLTLCL